MGDILNLNSELRMSCLFSNRSFFGGEERRNSFQKVETLVF